VRKPLLICSLGLATLRLVTRMLGLGLTPAVPFRRRACRLWRVELLFTTVRATKTGRLNSSSVTVFKENAIRISLFKAPGHQVDTSCKAPSFKLCRLLP
jgi:hypothetical protein